eukprot:76742-Rhodomonas_salina.1
MEVGLETLGYYQAAYAGDHHFPVLTGTLPTTLFLMRTSRLWANSATLSLSALLFTGEVGKELTSADEDATRQRHVR